MHQNYGVCLTKLSNETVRTGTVFVKRIFATPPRREFGITRVLDGEVADAIEMIKVEQKKMALFRTVNLVSVSEFRRGGRSCTAS